MLGDIEGMINGTGSVEQDHADDEDGHGDRGKTTGHVSCFGDQRNGGNRCKDHGDEVSQGTAWIFDVEFHVCTSGFRIMMTAYCLNGRTYKTISCSSKNYLL